MRKNKFLRKLLLFMTVFVLMFAVRPASQQPVIAAVHDDYVWCVERGGGDIEAGYQVLMVDRGELTHEDLYLQCIHNWYSVEVIEKMLNLGYMLDYEQQLKDGGWIPNNFVRTPIENPATGNSQSVATNPSHTQEEINAAWNESKRVEPTCTSDGYIEYKNSLTGDKKKETIPMVEHSYEKTETASTCTEAGAVTYTCTGCADSYTEELPLAEHSFNEMIPALLLTKASCTEDVKISYACSVCQTVMEETIPATGHDDGEWFTTRNAGLFSEGLKELKCTKDGAVLASETLPQTCPVPLGVAIALVVSVAGIVLGVALFAKKKHATPAK